MHLTGKQMGLMSKIMLAFAESHHEGQIREIVGDLVMQLLQAQYYASFVWTTKVRRLVKPSKSTWILPTSASTRPTTSSMIPLPRS